MNVSNATARMSENNPTLLLECLIKLISDRFDDDRYKLRSFIKQVDSAFELSESF